MNSVLSPNPSVLIKIGGNEIDDPVFLSELASVVRGLQTPVVIVHGGGKEISTLQQQLGIEPRYLDGVRITDAASLAVVEMVLCGVVNKRLVRSLLAGGVDALGLSGIDRGLIRAEKMQHPTQDMGFTGNVTSVRGEVLLDLLAQGVTPVIAPICLGEDSSYNVNADHVAGAVAAAIQPSKVIFLTNVEGVLVDGKPVNTLTVAQTNALIEDGTIFGGMIPKVKTALHALDMGVPQAVITNLTGLKTHGGTAFTRHSIKVHR
jgi:acetylglutamate kinase